MTPVRGLVVVAVLGLVLGACTRGESAERAGALPEDAGEPVAAPPTSRVPEALDATRPAPSVGVTDGSVPVVTDITLVAPDDPSLLRVDIDGDAISAGAVGVVAPQLSGSDATGRSVRFEPGTARAYVFVQPGDAVSEALVIDLVTYLDQFGLPGDGAIALTAVVTSWNSASQNGADSTRAKPGDWLVDRRWRGESLLDDPGSVAAAAFGVEQVPAVVLVDAGGRVADRSGAAPSTQIVANALLMVAPQVEDIETGATPASGTNRFDLGDIDLIQSSGELVVSVNRRSVMIEGREREAVALPAEVNTVAYDESPFGPPRSPGLIYALSDSARAFVPEVGYFRAECRRGEGGSPDWVALSPDQLRVLLDAGSFTGPAALTLDDSGDVVTIRMLLGC